MKKIAPPCDQDFIEHSMMACEKKFFQEGEEPPKQKREFLRKIKRKIGSMFRGIFDWLFGDSAGILFVIIPVVILAVIGFAMTDGKERDSEKRKRVMQRAEQQAMEISVSTPDGLCFEGRWGHLTENEGGVASFNKDGAKHVFSMPYTIFAGHVCSEMDK